MGCAVLSLGVVWVMLERLKSFWLAEEVRQEAVIFLKFVGRLLCA